MVGERAEFFIYAVYLRVASFIYKESTSARISLKHSHHFHVYNYTPLRLPKPQNSLKRYGGLDLGGSGTPENKK